MTRVSLHNGCATTKRYRYISLIDTGSLHSFNLCSTYDSTESMGATSVAYDHVSSLSLWGGFGWSAPFRTSTSVSVTVQFHRSDGLAVSLTVSMHVVPENIMQYAVTLWRENGMSVEDRSYRAHPLRPPNNKLLGELTLRHISTSRVRLPLSYGTPRLPAVLFTSTIYWRSWNLALHRPTAHRGKPFE